MLSLKPIITVLTPKPADFNGLWFRKVAGAAEYAQARDEALPLPMCWVVRAADKSDHVGDGVEDVAIAFDVVIAIENVRTHTAGDTDDLLLHYRQAVKKLLLGTKFTGAIKPIKFSGGAIVDYTNADLYWRDRYEVEAVIENYLPDPVDVFANMTKI
jgi:hypothetical protein